MVKINKEDKFDFITFENDEMEVTFSNLGASIYSIIIDGKYMTLTPKDVEDFQKDTLYHGKTIGRSANRIKGNKIQIKDKTYELDNNENENVLHGGKNGLSTKVFDYEYSDNSITFSYMSKDKESGFPGNLFVRVIYTINFEEKIISVDYSAQSDEKTVCSLTNHAYFTLGEDCIDNLQLYLPSSKYIFTDPSNLVAIRKDEITDYLDFRTPKLLSSDINHSSLQNTICKGYDHYFFFDEVDDSNQVILTGEKYQLAIRTNFEGIQIFSDNYADSVEFFGTKEEIHRGLALEPSDNHLVLHYLEPNEAYQRHIEYHFFKKQN